MGAAGSRVGALLGWIGCALLVSTAATAQQSELVDRIVAVVDGEVITLQQLHRAIALASTDLVSGGGICGDSEATADSERAVLECMVDNLLVFQHVRRFPQFGVLQEDIETEYAALVAQFDSRQSFEEELANRGLTPTEVRYDLEREALIGNYISARYRTVVDVRESELRRYHEEVLRPEMERRGAATPAFEAVEDEIRAILIETEVNRRVDEWIADLRRRAEIVVYIW
jgi:peptidyl-prolyl cis-trans isomerase SurA